jgi:biotin carboxylase
MVDFIVQDGRIVLLEMAPRPGGDCLPFLLHRAWGLDILKLFMDFSWQQPFRFETPLGSPAAAGLRLLAPRGGIFKQIDVHRIQKDHGVL